MRQWRLAIRGGLGVLAAVCANAALAGADDREIFFESKVRPLLVAHCLECHGGENPEANLQLISREAILRGGDSGPAAVPGEPDRSRIIEAVRYTSPTQMPPAGRLTDQEIGYLVEWVGQGLVWPASEPGAAAAKTSMRVSEADRAHWAFQPLRESPVPAAPAGSANLAPVDAFIGAKLAELGLQPAPPADRRTLLRRLYYDLIGLPPTYEQVEAFVADPAPDAVARVVDQLLASPRYGERWGRHWLDVARYADTKDGVLMYGDARLRPYAYTYRDYVIRAFNEDLPYDQFIQQQIAVDLLQPAVEPWQLAALGFLTVGRQYDNNVHDVIDDQIDTIGRGVLGLTVACARCHDHKYDPIPTADYYALYGVLGSSEVPSELPVIPRENPLPGQAETECALYGKHFELRQFVAGEHAKQSEIARNRTADYLRKIATEPPDPIENTVFFLSLTPEELRPPITIRWRRLLRERSVPTDPVFGLWHDLLQIPEPGEGNPPEAFAQAAQDVLARWAARPAGTGDGDCNPIVLAGLQEATLRNRGDIAQAYGDLLVANFRATSRGEQPNSAAATQLFELLTARTSPCYIPLSQTYRYTSRAETDQYFARLGELDVLAATSPGAAPRAMVVAEKPEPINPRIFVRGNPTNLGPGVPRHFVTIARTGEVTPFVRGSGRLELAQALTAPDNPLTPRVIVNRVWMYHCGEPLVATPSDFGRRSQPPTHPELLDYLASEFVRSGWSLKQLHRLIVLSQTYQMASQTSPAATAAGTAIDPENRFLWRMRRQRLDFEAMRDTLLSVAGRLEDREGGRPREIVADPAATCRTVYGLVDRQSLPAVYRAFDFASPDQSNERRPRTMMPQQALFALNSPFVTLIAQDLARHAAEQAPAADAERVRQLFHQVLAREPHADELSACLAFVAEPIAPQSTLSSWEQLAQVLVASNELMYVD